MALWLSACTATGSAALDPLYKPERGPYAVRVDDSAKLPGAEGRKSSGIRVVYPDAKGPFPVVIFSHGMFTSNERYMPILEHWASHGYVVVAPNHLDSNGGFTPRQDSDVEKLVVTRADDLTTVMDDIPTLEATIPGLKGKLKPPPYAAAGHSMGTYAAMLQAGLATRNPQTGEVTRHAEKRVAAVVMSSDPGKMALMPEALWRGIDVPTFITTGTDDYGVAGKGKRPAAYTAEILTGAAAPTPTPASTQVDRYRVVLEHGNHYYGGLVHRDPGGLKPDYEGLRIYDGLSTAFLDAYLKGDRKAKQFLKSVDVEKATAGRAHMDREP